MQVLRRLINKNYESNAHFFALIFSIVAAQADLVMELNWGSPMFKFVVKVKGDKVRWDGYLNGNNMASLIADLNTEDRFKLDHASKKIIKNPPILLDTNAFEKTASPQFYDTGKTEMLSGYEAEIYKWTNFDGITETLWVAKNYPNFDKIKNDLSKLDKLNDEKWILEFRSLPGMPLKLLMPDKNDAYGRGLTFTLLSAKEEPIDDINFDLPKDYHFYSSTNAPTAHTNVVISATNEPPAK